jgi:hypothetical protein
MATQKGTNEPTKVNAHSMAMRKSIGTEKNI